MTRRSDPNPAYWEQYGPCQYVKHELIRCYLNGWYPKLGTGPNARCSPSLVKSVSVAAICILPDSVPSPECAGAVTAPTGMLWIFVELFLERSVHQQVDR